MERGEGDPLVFVHGGLGDFRTWNPQLGPFSERYHAISYSRRGHYPNAWPEGYTICSMQDHVEDLAALIDTLRLGPVHIVANSYGGYLALFLALRYPGLVRSMALAEPPVHPLLRGIPGGEELYQDFMERAWRPAGRAFAGGDLEEGVRLFIEGAVGKGEFDRLTHRAREGMMKNSMEMKISTATPFEVHMPPLSCEDVAQIEAPTLLMRGELSPKKYYLINDELARCMPNVEQATIAGASHVLHSHNPQEHNEVVLAFLARH